MNTELLQQLLEAKKDNAVLSEKVSKILGKETKVSAYVPKSKEQEQKRVSLSVEETLKDLIANGFDMSNIKVKKPVKKAASNSNSKPNPTKPKADPIEAFSKKLIKLASKYIDKKPLFQYIDTQNGKQCWTNGTVALRMTNNIKSLEQIAKPETQKYPNVSTLIDSIAKGEDVKVSSKEINEATKGLKSDNKVIINGVCFSVGVLRIVASLVPNFTIYKAELKKPIYIKSDYFDGCIAPCLWDGNLENAKANGAVVINN